MYNASMNDRVLIVSVDEQGTLVSALHGTISAERIGVLEQDTRSAQAVIKEEYLKRGIKFKSLIDLSDFSGTYVPKALAVLGAYMKSNKPFIQKSAGFGAGSTTTLAANIVASLAGRDDISFFKTRQEAEAWLKGHDAHISPVTAGYQSAGR